MVHRFSQKNLVVHDEKSLRTPGIYDQFVLQDGYISKLNAELGLVQQQCTELQASVAQKQRYIVHFSRSLFFKAMGFAI